MRNNILVIGQAPPAPDKIQTVPYDTTLFYIMLEWVGVTKEQAQKLFLFESLSDTFPGKTKTGGHKAPGKKESFYHVQCVLWPLINISERVILFGLPVQKTIANYQHLHIGVGGNGKYFMLPHPSRRNWNLIMNRKEQITQLLKQCIFDG